MIPVGDEGSAREYASSPALLAEPVPLRLFGSPTNGDVLVPPRHVIDEIIRGVAIARLDASRIDQLCAVQKRWRSELSDLRFVYDRPRSYFEALLRGNGIVLGAFFAKELVGFSTVRFLSSAPELDHLCPFVPPAERDQVAVNSSTLVDARFRHCQVFARLYAERLRMVRALGFTHSVGIIFLLNRGSLAMAFRHGFLIRGTLVDQDGPNLLLHLDHRVVRRSRDGAARAQPERIVPLTDFEGHQAATAADLAGYGLHPGPAVSYRAMLPAPTSETRRPDRIDGQRADQPQHQDGTF
jgi:hypothetical protein